MPLFIPLVGISFSLPKPLSWLAAMAVLGIGGILAVFSGDSDDLTPEAFNEMCERVLAQNVPPRVMEPEESTIHVEAVPEPEEALSSAQPPPEPNDPDLEAFDTQVRALLDSEARSRPAPRPKSRIWQNIKREVQITPWPIIGLLTISILVLLYIAYAHLIGPHLPAFHALAHQLFPDGIDHRHSLHVYPRRAHVLPPTPMSAPSPPVLASPPPAPVSALPPAPHPASQLVFGKMNIEKIPGKVGENLVKWQKTFIQKHGAHYPFQPGPNIMNLHGAVPSVNGHVDYHKVAEQLVDRMKSPDLPHTSWNSQPRDQMVAKWSRWIQEFNAQLGNNGLTTGDVFVPLSNPSRLDKLVPAVMSEAAQTGIQHVTLGLHAAAKSIAMILAAGLVLPLGLSSLKRSARRLFLEQSA
jgi:hypothetical protein